MRFYIQHTALLLGPSLSVEMTASGVAAGWINTVFSKLRQPKLASAGRATSFCTGLGYSIGFISISVTETKQKREHLASDSLLSAYHACTLM